MPKRQRKLKRYLLLLGPGFISACAGIEITNVGVFSYVGSAYGFKLLWAIIVASIASAFIQQLAAVVGASSGYGLVSGVKVAKPKLLIPMLASLLLANVATAAVNILGVSLILSSLLEVPWTVVALGYVLLLWAACMWASSFESLEKGLSILTLTLASYIVIAVLELKKNPGALIQTLYGCMQAFVERRAWLDVIAIFGAAAAPYSIVFEASVTALTERGDTAKLLNEMLEIFVGLVFAIITSIAIAVTSALLSNGRVISSATDMYAILARISPLMVLLFVIGVVASSSLAVAMIALCATYVEYEIKGRAIDMDYIVQSTAFKRNLSETMLSSLVFAFALGFTAKSFASAVNTASIIISMTAWLPMLCIALLYADEKITGSYSLKPVKIAGIAIASLIALVNLLALAALTPFG